MTKARARGVSSMDYTDRSEDLAAKAAFAPRYASHFEQILQAFVLDYEIQAQNGQMKYE